MSGILVATDGSEGAERAVEHAAQMAKDADARLLIVTVVGGDAIPDQLFRSFTRSQQQWLREQLEDMAKGRLNRARERARQAGAADIELVSRTGDAVEAILDVADDKAADTVVVGKRGNGRVTGLLIGSVSQKLVSLSPVPVTVVP